MLFIEFDRGTGLLSSLSIFCKMRSPFCCEPLALLDMETPRGVPRVLRGVSAFMSPSLFQSLSSHLLVMEQASLCTFDSRSFNMFNRDRRSSGPNSAERKASWLVL